MQLEFQKYHGTGNDFIIMDDRHGISARFNRGIISGLCDRRFGIGADGLILVQEDRELDFRMVYHNSDGREGTMCGNGGRCAVAFARAAGIIRDRTEFATIDGAHQASVSENGIVSLSMKDVVRVKKHKGGYILNTGSPHYVLFTEDLDQKDVFAEGRKIRHDAHFMPSGINVNFVEIKEDELFVRTYERGVEDETLSCGTGNIASVISAVLHSGTDNHSLPVQTRGGEVRVSFNRSGDHQFTDIRLSGPAEQVFAGTININIY